MTWSLRTFKTTPSRKDERRTLHKIFGSWRTEVPGNWLVVSMPYRPEEVRFVTNQVCSANAESSLSIRLERLFDQVSEVSIMRLMILEVSLEHQLDAGSRRPLSLTLIGTAPPYAKARFWLSHHQTTIFNQKSK